MIPTGDQVEPRPPSTHSDKLASEDSSSSDGSLDADQAEKRCSNGSTLGEDGLVIPKKLANPCLESSGKKDLHRELLFNQKTGKNVLNQKSELAKVLEKRLDNKKKKELEQDKSVRRNSFERKLEEQALKIAQQEEGLTTNKDKNSITATIEPELEFLRIRAKLQAHHNNSNDQVNANTKNICLDNA